MRDSLRFGAATVAIALAAEAVGLFSPVSASPSGGTIQVIKSAWDYTQPASNPVSTVTNYAGLALSAMNGAACAALLRGRPYRRSRRHELAAARDPGSVSHWVCRRRR